MFCYKGCIFVGREVPLCIECRFLNLAETDINLLSFPTFILSAKVGVDFTEVREFFFSALVLESLKCSQFNRNSQNISKVLLISLSPNLSLLKLKL